MSKEFKANVIGSLLTICSFSASAGYASQVVAPKTLTGCWDGTFAYNAFSVQETADLYLVSTSGQSLVSPADDSFTLKFGSAWHVLDNLQWYESGILTVAFAKDQCTWNPATIELDCTKTGAEIFVTRHVQNLDQWTEATAVFHVGQVSVKVAQNAFTLDKTDLEGVTESLQVSSSPSEQCRVEFTPVAPDALVDFLTK